jgi:hypothetical protein
VPITKRTAEITVYNRAQEAVSSTLNEEVHEPEPPDSLSLVDQYVALLMATFIESALLEVGHPLSQRCSKRSDDSGLSRPDRRECQFAQPKSYPAVGGNATEGESYIASAVRCAGSGTST